MADAVVRKTGEEYLYPYIEKYVDDIFTVTEDSIRQAVRTACLYGKLTLEGSGALALAALLEKKCPLSPGTVLICSGGNIDKAVLDLCMQA
jgi:threonine dehydratase